MEIIIDIDENLYTRLFDNGVDNYDDAVDMAKAIRKGTPLPKGHGDLKDQKDLAKSLYDYQWIDQLTYMEVTNRLINTPTIIEADKEQE